jgi:hypothetical protein
MRRNECEPQARRGRDSASYAGDIASLVEISRRQAGGRAASSSSSPQRGPSGVLHAPQERLELVADGPISLGVDYTVRPAGGGSEVDASVSVKGRGLPGPVLATAAGHALRPAHSACLSSGSRANSNLPWQHNHSHEPAITQARPNRPLHP